jgi:phytoene synthase
VKNGEERSHLAEEAHRYDYDRWLTTLFAPASIRETLYALIAFNIELSRIRETVTEPLLGDIRLQWWREALTGLETHTPKTHPVIEALDFANRQKPIDFKLMQAMVDMRAKDLDPTPLSSDADFIAYADGTGGALHRLLLAASDLDVTEADEEAAAAAGRSFAMTGILRAIPFHFQHDLVLLPTERLEEQGATRNTIFQQENRSNFFNIVKELRALSLEENRRAKKLSKNGSKNGAFARKINGITGLYLTRLKKAGYDPGDTKMQIGAPRKILSLFLTR